MSFEIDITSGQVFSSETQVPFLLVSFSGGGDFRV